jgi:hypothetical protein
VDEKKPPRDSVPWNPEMEAPPPYLRDFKIQGYGDRVPISGLLRAEPLTSFSFAILLAIQKNGGREKEEIYFI